MATTATLIKQRKLPGYTAAQPMEADTRQSARASSRALRAEADRQIKAEERQKAKGRLLVKQKARSTEERLPLGPISKGPQRTRRGPSLDQQNEYLAGLTSKQLLEKTPWGTYRTLSLRTLTIHPTRGYRSRSYKSIEAERRAGMMLQGVPGFSLAENRKAIQAFA